jgi:AcrR family transcriptional regulator
MAEARRLRSDAKLNEDRLLEVAARTFAEVGTDASLKAIAAEAGVGIGTLYRRFPTRGQLVWAVYRSEVERICASVPGLLAAGPAVAALRTWMADFLEFLAVKRGMAAALKTALADDEDLRLETRALLVGALTELLVAGEDQGDIRPGVAPMDVMLALGGTALIAGEPEQREQAGRLLDLLMAGVRSTII